MKPCVVSIMLSTGILSLASLHAFAADKSGVSPQTISLPSGPGSIQGLGESFQPQLNSGSGAYSVAIQLPSGPAGFTPSLSLQYHTGNGNGCLGVGWKMSGLTMVSRNMDGGLPLYVDAANGLDDDFDGTVDNPEEMDRFSGVDLEELVPLPDATFRSESEESFIRYELTATGWKARTKGGLLHEFGTTSFARIENGNKEFAWLLERTTDLNGNTIEYRYRTDPGSLGQKYCSEMRWAGSTAFYAAVMTYEANRPDVHSDFRSGFEVRTGLRLARIDIIAQGVPASPGAITGDLNDDGKPDSLIRRYVLEYEAKAVQSLLRRVTMFGSDGVTSLPSVILAYTEWDPPDNVSSSFTRSTGDPIAALDSDNVELIDMNRDGLPDLLQATSASHRVHLNLGLNDAGRLAWDIVGTLVGNSPSLNLGSPAVHLADHSADGEADLIHKVNSSTFQCFINSGQRTWQNVVTLQNTDSWPRWPFENAGSRTLDTDHNRMHDILFTSDNSYRLWMLMPGGRYGREVSLPVLSDGTQAFSFEDPGARIADVNGDRITDLAWIQSTRVVYWASCGRGSFDGPIFLPLSGTLTVTEISNTDFADVNGDALADLIVVRPAASPNGIHYRLNRGRAGFDLRRTILGLPATQTGDATRCTDMNGNGSVDLLISNGARSLGTREQFLDFVPGIRPHLLRRIDNGLGLVTTLEFETSVQQMVQARTAGTPWTSTMPISIPVVCRITEDDSRGNQFIREFTYRDPYYDPVKQEFRGFSNTQVKELGDASAPSKITQYVFDTGVLADCRKGKVLVQEVSDASGSRFERVENTVQHRVLDTSSDGRQVCFAFNEATDVQIFEQTNNPMHIRTGYQFDDFGNVLQENMQGVADQDGDEVFMEKAYAYRPEIWLMDRMTRSTTRDGKGTLAAEDLLSYDQRGNLIEQRAWLDVANRYVLSIRNDYDSFGNVIRMTDANDHSRSITFDDLLHTYPVTETVHLESRDLTTTATYDLGFGVMTSTVDFAGATTVFEYDPLARQIAALRPGGAETRYSYELAAPISRTITRVREDFGGGTFDSYAYVDGYGRALGTKIEAEDGRWRFMETVAFNRRMLEITRWLPYFTASNEYEIPDPKMPFNTTVYDAKGRIIQTIDPDGDVTRTIFEPLVQHLHDANDTAGTATPKTQRNDGLERLVEVVERNGSEEYRTRYAWDALNNLVVITDAQGNTKTMEYDSLKRNIALHDPDRGTATYEYDDAGNLLRTTDAKGQSVAYAYDFADRLLSENYLDQGGGPGDPVDVTLVYDLPAAGVDFGSGLGVAGFTGGRLASVKDLSGEEHRAYDARGNILEIVKRIRDPLLGVLTSYQTGFAYDIMDRLVEVYYPDNDRCRYSYNVASFVESIDGGLGGSVILSNADYEPTEQFSHLTFGNAGSTTYTYDNHDRLESLRTASPLAGDLINYAYLYDPVSNITRINDHRPFDGPHGIPASSPRRNTQLFQYDDLYRLTQVKYSPAGDGVPAHGQIDYVYDKIGNMLSQSSPSVGQPGFIPEPKVALGAMTIGGSDGAQNRGSRLPGQPPGPHALTATQAGGVYEYDDNGNMTHLEDATLTWDFKDRLVRFQKGNVDARYAYDYSNRRIAKLVTQDKHTDQTLYVNQYFEYRPNRAPVKYVFNGATRVARVKGTLDPTRTRVQRFWLFEGWNLLTVAVEAFQTSEELFGKESRVYEWTGTDYREVTSDAIVPVGKPLWVEVTSSRVVAASGLYLPPTDSVAIPAGQTLLAWPRLEPFIRAEHLFSSDGRIRAHEPSQLRWFASDRLLLAFLNDAPDSLPTSTALWFELSNQSMLKSDATEDRDISFYHGDHLGSVHVVTNQRGAVLQESANYAFGLSRHSHKPNPILGEDYGFTQKEKDEESDLHYFEARYLAAGLSRFLTLDPKYTNPGMLAEDDLPRFLSQPQDLNVYAYVRNNPIANLDPDGMELFAIGRTLGDSTRAQEIQRDFVSLLGRLSDLDLQVDEFGKIRENPDGLMNPNPASPKLQAYTRELISSKVKVTMNVRDSHGSVIGPGGGWDTFFENPGLNRAGTVWLKDWQETAANSPNFARIGAAHVLTEYRWRGAGFNFAHARGSEFEALVADELIGHSQHEEHSATPLGGSRTRFNYGAGNSYIWNSATNAVSTGPAVTEVPLPP
ncbi:MAG: toxin TcdB middle/N-terminal domain-containing protein [Planctomycetota bacterium]